MTKQPEALRLADLLEDYADSSAHCGEAAIELLRLHEVNAELLEALEWMVENDETNEGDKPVDSLNGSTWDEFNAYWIAGLNRAKATILKATGETK